MGYPGELGFGVSFEFEPGCLTLVRLPALSEPRSLVKEFTPISVSGL